MRSLPWLVVTFAGCAFDPRGVAPGTDGGGGGPGVDAPAGDGGVVPDASAVDAPAVDARAVDATPIDATPIDAAPPRCVGYAAVAGAPASSRYRRVNALTRWDVAAIDCTGDGGYLAVPDSSAEAVAVAAFVAPAPDSPFYWAGVSKVGTTWTTVLGVPASYLPWAAGQPNGGTNDIYVLVDVDGEFYDWQRNGTQEYACECNP